MQNFNLNTVSEKPSILKLMVENPEGVKATIDLLKDEMAAQVKQSPPKLSATDNSARQFSHLSSLLNSTGVREMVNDVAGENAVDIMDRTLGTIDSSCSAEVKQQAFSKGIRSAHSNLKNLDTLRENQSFNFAASLIGLDERKFKSLYSGSSNKLGC